MSIQIRLLLCLFFPLLSQAQDVVIRSTQDLEETIQLGFLPFEASGGGSFPTPPDRVLLSDLEFSGRFEMFEISQMDSTSLRYLNEQLVMAYVRGSYHSDGKSMKLKCELIDVETGDAIIEEEYATSHKGYRQVAHRFADELVYQLFGEKGIAQTQICYVSKRAGNRQVYVMDYDGAGVITITNNKTLNVLPGWYRDRQQLLFTSFLSGYPSFYIRDLTKGSNQVYLKTVGMNSSPHFNPVDDEIAYASAVDGNTEIFRKPSQKGRPIRLTFSGSIETSPSWAPNGYELAFTSDRSGSPMVYIMDRDGSNIRRLTYEGKYNTTRERCCTFL
ncbi:MAG: hypothetical protein F6K07_31655, partial [Okeania sp. SIO1H5]|uniref:hypothetical protein n=1 Tax=Okeania sp. SIO1H5 TaxID=2607777 RepID=UPI0013B9DFB4